MTRRPSPHGIDREALIREVEPIRCEIQAQAYGHNVHSLFEAKARAFDAKLRATQERSRRPTLDEILGGTDPWLPGGGAAA